MFSSSSNIKGRDDPIIWCLWDLCNIDSLSEPQQKSVPYPKSLVKVSQVESEPRSIWH